MTAYEMSAGIATFQLNLNGREDRMKELARFTAQCFWLIFEIFHALIQRIVWCPLLSMIRHWHGPIKAYDEEMDRQLSIQPLLHSAHFLIVNKPFDINIDNGKCDTPDSQVSRSGRPSVESVLQKRYPSYYLRNCHQLDYGTSGWYIQ